jgi:transcriptional regulator with XRE-family HTH domain
VEIERKRSWLLEQTGIKSSTWSSWERYGRIPPADRALAIADALGLTVEFLVSGRETGLDMRAESPVVTEIVNRVLQMNESQREEVLAAITTILAASE